MSKIIYLLVTVITCFSLGACEDKDYAMGLPEYENHYYAAYIPNNNGSVSVQRTQTSLLKFPVQFYSAYTRDYDATAYYAINVTDIAAPAVPGVDFEITDKDGNALTAGETGKYALVFPHAERAMDTIYVKMLNNPEPGSRKMVVEIQENQTTEYYVDIFSTAYKRTVEIK